MTNKASEKNQALSPEPGSHSDLDDITEPGSAPEQRFSIVGVGASAGGLAAFEAFFSAMPTDANPGIAIVLVQHLAPDHKSILSNIIRRYTKMQVFEVEDGMVVQPNCAYIIPPNRNMALLNGTLQLLEPSATRGPRMSVDFFFRSLAQDQHERAIGIVLSGTGSDGTLGLRAIKAEGGMVLAQTPTSTEYDGMPRSAIATGLVDYVLPPAEMPAQIIAYVAHVYVAAAPDKTPWPVVPPPSRTKNALKKVFVLLRAQTGHDFSQYKPSTIQRRIERRMAIQQIENMTEYVKYLQETPVEVEALFRDMLISVTNFFRDPEVFEFIKKQIIPKLFARKPAGGTIRIWTTGCATGEEAYSLAILLAEYQETLKQNFTIQYFATDIDSQAIAIARAGIFPASIAVDISPERLTRFFTIEPGGGAYRIHKTIRDMLIFSEQSLIKDPPFSRLDLISCRNLLIYMDGALQKKLIPLFHYVLNPGGFLVLGTSESVGDFSDLFISLDGKLKLYQRKEDFQKVRRTTPGSFLPPMTAPIARRATAVRETITTPKPSLRELTEQALLQQIAPTAVLVNRQGDILYIYGRTGLYLEPSPGEAGINNILKMARQGLHHDLAMALHKAVTNKKTTYATDLIVETSDDFRVVNLTVYPIPPDPVGQPDDFLYLVILEQGQVPEHLLPKADAPPRVSEDPLDEEVDIEAHLLALQQELRTKEEYLQTTTEELKTSNEELQASNEEMQSINEEMQSTNEELETSKEELQSINEELSIVNSQQQIKVTDLSRANNDMKNLMATGIGTILVDQSLRILRFTPAAKKIINLIPSDVGRPLSHIVSNLVNYDNLVPNLQEVLETLIPKEAEVQTRSDTWYTMRIRPYRTMENVIEGVVVTFFEITERKKLAEELHQAELREAKNNLSKAIVATVREPLLVFDANLQVISANRAFYNTFQVTPEDTIGRLFYDLGDKQWDVPDLHKLLEVILPQNAAFSDFQITHDFAKIGRRTMLLNARRIVSEAGQPEMILLAIEDVTRLQPDESKES